LPWFHIVTLLTKLDEAEARAWYFGAGAGDLERPLPDDKPTIGLLLCRQKKRLVAEYALSGIEKPIGVAEYQLLRDLPEPLGRDLPSIEQIEAEFAGERLSEDEEPGEP